MGKYIKKSKINSAVVVPLMEVSPQSLGVRTRAKSVALAAQQSLPSPFSYLQLRNRRLHKPPTCFSIQPKSCRKPSLNPTPNSSRRSREFSVESSSVGSVSQKKAAVSGTEDANVKVSLEENHLLFEGNERNIRESTPCSSIRDSEFIGFSGSTEKGTCLPVADERSSVMQINIMALEIEEFFSCAEQQQRRLFIEKYNFDIDNDTPLPGRYEWMQLLS